MTSTFRFPPLSTRSINRHFESRDTHVKRAALAMHIRTEVRRIEGVVPLLRTLPRSKHGYRTYSSMHHGTSDSSIAYTTIGLLDGTGAGSKQLPNRKAISR